MVQVVVLRLVRSQEIPYRTDVYVSLLPERRMARVLQGDPLCVWQAPKQWFYNEVLGDVRGSIYEKGINANPL